MRYLICAVLLVVGMFLVFGESSASNAANGRLERLLTPPFTLQINQGLTVCYQTNIDYSKAQMDGMVKCGFIPFSRLKLFKLVPEKGGFIEPVRMGE